MSKEERKHLELIRKQLEGTLTAQEASKLRAWIAGHPGRQALLAYLSSSAGRNHQGLEAIYEAGRKKYNPQAAPLQHTLQSAEQPGTPVRNNRRFQWMAIAAAALLCMLAGYFLFQQKNTSRTAFHPIADVAPGKAKATLTLEDGAVIALDDTIEQQRLLNAHGIVISEAEGGELVYNVNPSEVAKSDTQIHYHTIRTPAAGRYQVYLPDGSKVWLNAESSLRYPVPFSTAGRQLELEGEAYFEIAERRSDAGDKVPFVVISGNQRVEVLGTHFNINAYKNEPGIKTTLLEGSVRIALPGKNGEIRILEPGQQAVCREQRLHVHKVDTTPVVAWKEGLFIFDDEELHSVMRKISRWYNVEVKIQDNLPPLYFGGSISRDKNLSDVLKIIELTGNVQCRIEASKDGQERRVVIMK